MTKHAQGAPDPIMGELRKIRQERRMSVRQVGRMLGVAPVTVGTWERGERQPSLTKVRQYAALFGLCITLRYPKNGDGPAGPAGPVVAQRLRLISIEAACLLDEMARTPPPPSTAGSARMQEDIPQDPRTVMDEGSMMEGPGASHLR